MRHHTLPQGSPEWHAHRRQHFNASDAPAMLGCSPYKTRTRLLHELHTGLTADVDAATQRRFDDGHRYEALARPLGEQIIGEDLYPVVGTSGKLSASFDGLTMAEDVAFEHKSLNDDLRACMPAGGEFAPDLPKHYRVQMEQQLMVSGAEKVLFMASKWNGETLVEERHCWYHPDAELRAEILRGWDQLEADLCTYVPPAASAVERIVAEPVEALPAPVVQVTGQLTLKDNFKVFEERLRKFLDTELIREPKTDEDFATLDVQIKAMKGAEAALESAEAQMLAQIQSVDQAKKTKDMLAELVRKNRLLAERLLKDEKERRREAIVAGGAKDLQAHVAALNVRLGKPYMPQSAAVADFARAIHGLKSLASMEDKVATTLASAKIAANHIADGIQANLAALRELAAEHPFLFADTATLVLKAADDCRAVITSRIAEHRAAEERRLEGERARIRAEEEARAAEKVRQQEQEARDAEERRIAAEDETQRLQNRPALLERAREIVGDIEAAEVLRDAVAAPAQAAANVHPMPTRAPAAPAGPPTLRLGEIQKRLAASGVEPTLSAAFLAALGIESAGRDRAAILYHEHQFAQVCDALIAHIATARDQRQAA